MISVEHLVKCYGDYKAVDDLNFNIESGKIYGLLGPNGAGKSTTMNMMTGCLSITEGKILIDGLDIYEDAKEAKKLIGYLPEIPPLYLDETPYEYLTFVAKAKGVKKDELSEQIDKAIERTGILDVKDRLIKKLSKGYKQRVGIAQALLGDPKVIILDEPTVGLDPVQIIEIRDLIKKLGEDHTVILSSHILSEIQEVCDEVIIISKGKLVLFDKIDNLDNALNLKRGFELRAYVKPEDLENMLKTVDLIKDFEIEKVDDEITKATLYTDTDNMDETGKELFLAFSKLSLPVIKLNPLSTSLEDVFIELTSQGVAPEEEKVKKNLFKGLFKGKEKEEKEEGKEEDKDEDNL